MTAPAAGDSFVESTRAPALRLPEGQLKARLPQPMTLVLNRELTRAQIHVAVPLASISPVVAPEAAQQIETATLYPPWVESAVSVPVRVCGSQLELTFHRVDPAALRKLPMLVMLGVRDGQSRLLELKSPGLVVDRTEFERDRLAASLAQYPLELASLEESLAQAQATLRDPSTLVAHSRGQLDAARDELAALAPQIDARRLALGTAIGDDPRLWGLSARFPFAASDSPEAAIGELAKRLLELNNQHFGLTDRIANLRHSVGQLSFLTGPARESATRPMKAELEQDLAAVSQIDVEMSKTLGELKRLVKEGGLEDPVLAASELALGRLSRANAPGSLGALLADRQSLQRTVAFLGPHAGHDQAGAVAEMHGFCDELKGEIVRFQELLSKARANLAALDESPVTNLVPAGY